jgi:hypothetical protein
MENAHGVTGCHEQKEEELIVDMDLLVAAYQGAATPTSYHASRCTSILKHVQASEGNI